MVGLGQETRFPCWAKVLGVLLVVMVALFVRLYGHDPDALLGFEEMDLFSGVDFVLSFAYHLDQPDYPVRGFLQTRFPGMIPPLEVHSPFMNRPWTPAREYNEVIAAHTLGSVFIPRPLGANLGVPFEDRTYSGFPKTFHNIGIQRYHPGTPEWFIGALLVVFLGDGVTNFSLNLLPPIVALRLSSILFSTMTCVMVFYIMRRWFQNGRAGIFASLFLAVEPIFLTVSRDAKVDTGQAFFVLLIVWAYWEARKRRGRRWLILTGVLIGFGLATKGQAVIFPLVLFVWDLLRYWLRNDIGRLRYLKPLFMVGFFLLTMGLPVLLLGYWVIPEQMMVRAFESAWGFTVSVVGSYLFILLVCLGGAWPLGQSRRLLKIWPVFICSGWIKKAVSSRNWRGAGLLDLAMLVVIAIITFAILVPNAWGAPVQWILGWFAHYGGTSSELRSAYFVTRTVYLPVYYYPAIMMIKTSLPFLAALVAGIVVSIRWLRSHPLRDSSASRALLLMFVVCILYLVPASGTPFHKEPKELAAVFPFFAMWAGLGMTWLISRIIEMARHPRFHPTVSVLAGGGIIAVGLFNCVTHVPYTGIFYNHLIGPPENGARIEWLNFNAGSGYERAARYIHRVYGNDKKVLGSGEVGWMNMSYPNVYTVGPLPAETSVQDVYELIQDYDIVVIHRMETQRRPHFVFHQFFAQQVPTYRITINGVKVIQIFDVRQVRPPELEMNETTQNSHMASLR